MEYKGFIIQRISFDEKQMIFSGQSDVPLLGHTCDIITYEGTTPADFIQAFRDSVDDDCDFRITIS